MVRGLIRKLFGGKQSTPLAQVHTANELDHLKKHIQQLHMSLIHQQHNVAAWNHYLHSSLNDVQKAHKELKTTNHASLDRHAEHILDLREQVKKTQAGQNNAMVSVQKDVANLKHSLLDTFKGYNEHILQLHRQMADLRKEITLLKEPKEPLAQPSPQQRQEQPVATTQQQTHVKETISKEQRREQQHASRNATLAVTGNLTPSEKQILAVMLATDKKYSYRDLSAECSKSPSTIKTQICSLKNKGIPLKEYIDADGSKRYYIPEEYKKAV